VNFECVEVFRDFRAADARELSYLLRALAKREVLCVSPYSRSTRFDLTV